MVRPQLHPFFQRELPDVARGTSNMQRELIGRALTSGLQP